MLSTTSCSLRFKGPLDSSCDTAVENAHDKINGHELSNNIRLALQQMMEKSGQPHFKVVVAGYLSFFNADTKSCNHTTFKFLFPSHHPVHLGAYWAYLDQSRRIQVNKVAIALNNMLSQAIDSVNAQYSSPRARFFDPNPAFDGKRFCENHNGIDVIEPDLSRMETYFFLAGWKDNADQQLYHYHSESRDTQRDDVEALLGSGEQHYN